MNIVPSIHPDLKRQLIGGKDLLSQVERLANELANLMREIHGDTWSVGINHDAGCFVIVARDFSKPGRASA